MKSVASLVLGLSVYLLWPAHALADALVRFVHAVPGVGAADVKVSAGAGTVDFGSIAFAQVSGWHSLRSGRFVWVLHGTDGKTLARGSATLGNGSYTAVVLAETKGVVLGIYRDRAGEPGKSLVRVIHAAPELGSPSLKLDSQVVLPRLDFTKATPYLSVNPGVHSLAAMRSGDTAPLLSIKVRLVSGVAYSGIVVGSRGQMVRVVTVTDRGAPLTRPGPAAHTGAGTEPTSSGGTSQWVTVKPGDSLWEIARRQVGPRAGNSAVERELVRIWDANASRIGTGDPNLIFPGQRLHLRRA